MRRGFGGDGRGILAAMGALSVRTTGFVAGRVATASGT